MLIFSMSYAQKLPFPSNQQRQANTEITAKTDDYRLKEQPKVPYSEKSNSSNNRRASFQSNFSPSLITYLPVTPGKAAKSGNATVVLVAGDLWKDGTGYQMLLDADATAYGTTIPVSNHLTSSGNAPSGVYESFEYKIPTNADGLLTTKNIVFNDSVAVTIPAGIYDYCIVNPVPSDRIYIPSGYSTGNDYHFEAGYTYIFKAVSSGNSDQITLTILIPQELSQAVSNFTATPDANEALTCELSWVNPSLTLGGDPLSSIDSIVIERNKVIVHTISNPTIGASLSWTDNVPTNGFYNYSIYAVNSDGRGVPVSINDVVVGTHPCTIAINTFPWAESFEDNESLRCWNFDFVQGNVEWRLGTTASAIGVVAYFLNPTATATPVVTKYVSPKLDITALDVPVLNFKHLQLEKSGSLDTLRVYYKTSETGAWNLLAAWTNNIPTWTEEIIPLPNGSNDYYIAFEGTAYRGDGIGIDDVVIKGLFGVDATVVSITAPNSGTNLTNSETVTVSLKNLEADTIHSLALKLFVNDSLIATETATTPIASLSSVDYTFIAKADLSSVQTHEIKVVANLLNDVNSNNDTLSKKVINYGDIVVMGVTPTVTTCNAVFVDDGIHGDYLADSNPLQLISFFPENEGDKVTITLNEFNTAYLNDMLGYDAFYIASGHYAVAADIDPQSILNGYAGDMSEVLPVSITSTSVDGALTILFAKGNYFGRVASGWNATISCMTPPDNDAYVLGIISPLHGGSEAATISVDIKNMGLNPITEMDIYYQVNNGRLVKETFTGNIASYTTTTFSFVQTTDLSAYQNYEVVVYTQLANDDNPSNDTARISLAYQPPVTLYGYLMYDDVISRYSFVSFTSTNPSSVNVHKAYSDGANQIYSGVYYDNHLYGFTRLGTTPGNFVTFNTSWSMLRSTPSTIPTSDATFDYSTNTLYAIAYNDVTKFSDLYKVDVNTGATTLAASLDQNYLVMACDNNGVLYGITRVSADFYRINKNTGVSTRIGSTGMSTPSYAQSMTFDHATDRLFWAFMTDATGHLVEINPTTGRGIDLGKIGNNSEIVMLYTPVDGVAVSSFNQSNINIYPNPATDQITVEGTQGATVNIYDITGKVLLTNTMYSDRETINVSQLSAGVYIVELQDQKSKITTKLIKR